MTGYFVKSDEEEEIAKPPETTLRITPDSRPSPINTPLVRAAFFVPSSCADVL